MRTLRLVGAAGAAAALLIAGASPALATENEVGLHQDPPITADDPEFAHETCPPIAADLDGWHFVLPGNSTTFVELRVTFEPGGEQVVTEFGPPTDKHAYVASEPGATLVEASATVEGEPVDFRLSHTCPATEEGTSGTTGGEETTGTTGTTGGEETTGTTGTTGGEESAAVTGGEETTGTTGTSGTTGGEAASGEEGMAASGGESGGEAGGDSGGDLAETGSSTPVAALGAGAALLLAAGGYLALRRRNAARQS
ncbi:LPXTG cell wall anchor domain-containing protein [Streptomyces sp. DSM 44917]|uniref:LPXTG cell wall anchor domain-containing protein n=1 Tax=Streptomyces boetiae TaxID=3075541 RepID=A0ABU2LGM5_9ACTN|nr:LPXTG cell wall anchor domain-containing protein [Streptomyces sp. DSM 44917]MDT0310313.1 LPXTG cell wall anchor domain-containing protein [Streptomyces sp. DSM 44917]